MLKEMGMAALNLTMTDRVCRTEYSVLGHTELLRRVTGLEPSPEATRAFARAWDICLHWSVRVSKEHLGPFATDMGHAVYAEGGTDFREAKPSPFADEEAVFRFDPLEGLPFHAHGALVEQFDAHYAANCAAMPDLVNMTGIYITCMSGLIDMLGWDLLLTCAAVDPKAFGAFTDRYAQWMERFFAALAASQAPVVMIHDDIVWTEGPFLSPAWYRAHIFPNYERCFRPLLEAGKKILYTSDGNYSAFIDDIARTGVHGFVLEPSTDMGYIAERYGRTHVFVGNADTRVLLLGGRDDIYREVKRCMDIGKACPGFIMAVGNHIPANTPVDSCLYYDEFCKALGRR